MGTTANPVRRTLVALSEAGVRFVVCDGVACVLQGVPRATHDLDLRVALEPEDLAALLSVARALGLRPRIQEPPAASGAFAVDVFLRYPLSYDTLAADADVFHIDGHAARVSNKRHLIEAKRAVQPPRKQDLRDIEDLEELLHGEREADAPP